MDIRRSVAITTTVSQVAATLRFEDISSEVIAKAKVLIADTLSVAWAGRDAAGSAEVAKLAAADGGAAEATVWATGKRLPITSAAFVNTFHAAALDYDSLNGSTHADLVVLPAAFAVAERQKASGRDFLTAYILGAELLVRLGRATEGASKGWSATSVYGGFAAAIASARLLGLDAIGIGNALGLCLGQAAGSQQANVEQVLLKRLQPALATRAGVFSALLAKVGISGPTEAFEGRFGFRNLYLPFDAEKLLDGFGETFIFNETGLKKYPVCACSHAPMEALLQLVDQHDLTPDQIDTVEATISPFMARLVDNPDTAGADPQVLAQFSLRYALASILQRRRLGLEEITPEAVHEPEIARLSQRVTILVDDERTGSYGPATVSLRLKDGRTLVQTIDTLPGSHDMPLSQAQIDRKLQDCAGHGSRRLNLADLRSIIDKLDRPDAVLDRNFRVAFS